MRGLILFCLLLLLSDLYAQRLTIEGKEVFVNGINLPWRFFGKDFGGVGREQYDTNYYNRTFADFQEYGVNAVRIWLHCDGRYSPSFDREGAVIGLPRTFIADFVDFTRRAERYGLMVLPVLWTFEMVDRARSRDLLTDQNKRQSYIDQALIPLLEATASQCNILAWEIINEPEWAMDIPYGGTTENPVGLRTMQQFVAAQAHAIHTYSGHRVTVGSAGLRFINDMYFRTKNYWHDTHLQADGESCSGAYLDFYSVHYYRWIIEPLSPFKQSVWKFELDKPVLVSEFGMQKRQKPSESLQTLFDHDYAGAMPWSVNARDGVGTWIDYREPLQSFAQSHSDLMLEPFDCQINDLDETYVSCRIFPNPARHEIRVSHSQPDWPIYIEIVSMMGHTVAQWDLPGGNDIQLPIDHLAAGMYMMRIFVKNSQGKMRQRSRQKIMIAH